MIASDFIYQALRKIGELRPGYTAAPEFLADALTEWTAMFDEMGAERNTNYSNPVFQHNVTGPGSQTNGNGYQIGPTAADWVQPRPESIIRANLVLLNTGSQPVYIQLRRLSQEEWAAKSIQIIPATTVTSDFYYDPQFPNGVFNVFPPLIGNAIQIYQWGVLAPPATLGASYAAPPGFWDMIVFGLAERLYYMRTRQVLPREVPYQVISAKALEARQKIKNVNRDIPRLANDAPSGRHSGGYYDSNVTWTGEPY